MKSMVIRFAPGILPAVLPFYHEAGGFIIGGDVLFNLGVGRTDLPGGDFNTLVNSIQTQFFTLRMKQRFIRGMGGDDDWV
jgi:glyoxylase-like metal-dependent hydrolase (beta-lactamase superfamily II)